LTLKTFLTITNRSLIFCWVIVVSKVEVQSAGNPARLSLSDDQTLSDRALSDRIATFSDDNATFSDHIASRRHHRSPDANIVAAISGRPFEIKPPTVSPRRKIATEKKIAPEKALQSFNTWHFKREQPGDPRLMLEIVAQAISVREPIPFVLYWGKGPRCRLGEPDVACLDFLASLGKRVREVYERGAAIKLIFTDTHAELNGHPRETIERYFADVDTAARARGFESCWLGQLTRAMDTAAANEQDHSVVAVEALSQLATGAMKWYRGEGSAEQGALEYYRMNMVERRAVEQAFPSSIFVTFNGSKLRELFPKSLPIFYMYSLRRGVSVKPWFLPADAARCEASTCHCVPVDAERADQS
jgi:hypothetical protein